MNAESNSNIQRTQSGKSTSYKRAHRANRPVLVTAQKDAPASGSTSTTQVFADTPASVEETPVEQTTVSAEPARKRGPRFFSNVNRADASTDQPQADPIAARLTRALRGKSADAPGSKEQVKEKKATSASGSTRTTTSTPPKSGFKMKYIWGMLFYLLVADFLGVWITDFMQSHGMDAVVFTISTFQAKRSTLVFLALLVIILVVMARLDFIPRTLGAAMSPSQPGKNTPGSSSRGTSPTFDSREPQPTIKQGVQGENDNLYREYRENQRYFQKRDRKR